MGTNARNKLYRIEGSVWIQSECVCSECGHTHRHEREDVCDEQVWAFNEEDAMSEALERLLVANFMIDDIDWDGMPSVTVVEEESEAAYLTRMGARQLFRIGEGE